MVKLSQNPLEVYEVSINPIDVSIVSCVGKQVFRLYRLKESQDENQQKIFSLELLSQQLNNPGDNPAQQKYNCHLWIENQLIVCNDYGEILILNEEIKDGTQQWTYQSTLKDSPINIMKAQHKSFQDNKDFKCSIECIVQTQSKGFVVGGDKFIIFVYKPTQNQFQPFQLVQQINNKSTSDFKEELTIKGTFRKFKLRLNNNPCDRRKNNLHGFVKPNIQMQTQIGKSARRGR